MKDTNVVESIIKTPVESNLLKWSAGQAIFCPNCQNIMDWRKTVVATIHAKTDKTPEKVIKSYVVCVECWDKVGHRVTDGVDKFNAKNVGSADGATAWTEIVDGREERFNDFD